LVKTGFQSKGTNFLALLEQRSILLHEEPLLQKPHNYYYHHKQSCKTYHESTGQYVLCSYQPDGSSPASDYFTSIKEFIGGKSSEFSIGDTLSPVKLFLLAFNPLFGISKPSSWLLY